MPALPALCDPRHLADYLNLLEPESLVRLFVAFPPHAFEAFISPEGTPAFTTRFDLLTTTTDSVRLRVASLPFYRFWSKALMPRTCFVGTTVSEYALFPRALPPASLVEELKARHTPRYPFLIIKDVPQDSPLLDAPDNAHALEVVNACRRAGFVLVEGQALAYVPIDFESIDAYLSRLSASRRKDIRRKLRARADLSVDNVPLGDDRFQDAGVLDEYYSLYLNVYNQSTLHFDLLSATFFRALLQDASTGGISFEYRHAGRLIGYNICFVSHGQLIDKYVGFRYPDARAQNLYFVSWFHNLAYALDRGLTHYVAGWTDPEIKAYLGARFTSTRHAVYIRNRVLRAVLRRLTSFFERDRMWHEAT